MGRYFTISILVHTVCMCLFSVLVLLYKYLGKIGGFANSVDTAEDDSVWAAIFSSCHSITQYIHTALRTQDLHARLFQCLLHSGCHSCNRAHVLWVSTCVLSNECDSAHVPFISVHVLTKAFGSTGAHNTSVERVYDTHEDSLFSSQCHSYLNVIQLPCINM